MRGLDTPTARSSGSGPSTTASRGRTARPRCRRGGGCPSRQDLDHLRRALEDVVGLAGHDRDVHRVEPPDPFAVHVRHVGGRAVEVAELVPVAVEKGVDVVLAGEAHDLVDEVRVPEAEVDGVVRAERAAQRGDAAVHRCAGSARRGRPRRRGSGRTGRAGGCGPAAAGSWRRSSRSRRCPRSRPGSLPPR